MAILIKIFLLHQVINGNVLSDIASGSMFVCTFLEAQIGIEEEMTGKSASRIATTL